MVVFEIDIAVFPVTEVKVFIFDNDIEIIVDCSFRSLENQLSRASRLDLILRNHKNS